jgi:hypothetical protein
MSMHSSNSPIPTANLQLSSINGCVMPATENIVLYVLSDIPDPY